MAREYVENRDGGYYVTGSQVSLESVIFLFLDGASPESIVDEFPTLSLEQVYGAITFYLADRAKIDAYLTESDINGIKRFSPDFTPEMQVSGGPVSGPRRPDIVSSDNISS